MTVPGAVTPSFCEVRVARRWVASHPTHLRKGERVDELPWSWHVAARSTPVGRALALPAAVEIQAGCCRWHAYWWRAERGATDAERCRRERASDRQAAAHRRRARDAQRRAHHACGGVQERTCNNDACSRGRASASRAAGSARAAERRACAAAPPQQSCPARSAAVRAAAAAQTAAPPSARHRAGPTEARRRTPGARAQRQVCAKRGRDCRSAVAVVQYRIGRHQWPLQAKRRDGRAAQPRAARHANAVDLCRQRAGSAFGRALQAARTQATFDTSVSRAPLFMVFLASLPSNLSAPTRVPTTFRLVQKAAGEAEGPQQREEGTKGALQRLRPLPAWLLDAARSARTGSSSATRQGLLRCVAPQAQRAASSLRLRC